MTKPNNIMVELPKDITLTFEHISRIIQESFDAGVAAKCEVPNFGKIVVHQLIQKLYFEGKKN